jgi:hypothetical protein
LLTIRNRAASDQVAGSNVSRRSALRKFLPLAAILASGVFLISAVQDASAQQANNGQGASQNAAGAKRLRSHFDIPPAPLNSVPLPDPYIHWPRQFRQRT